MDSRVTVAGYLQWLGLYIPYQSIFDIQFSNKVYSNILHIFIFAENIADSANGSI